MNKKPIRVFVSSCEPQKEEATPTLVPKLRFLNREKPHTKARRHEEEEDFQ
jgi:hypothetical protein